MRRVLLLRYIKGVMLQALAAIRGAGSSTSFYYILGDCGGAS
jgi:hypothetical protein